MIRRVGPYELTDLLGRGGMGAVYRGRHVATGALRAVKVLEGAKNETAAARFEREGQALARVRHPAVVAVHEVGVDGGTRWLAMDLVEGETLEAIASRGPLEPARAARLIEDVARGIGALHAAGIVHRDLKPANVLVRPDGRPVVLDLGLALAPDADERLTRTGGVAGTLAYLAPEQLRGEASPRTDVHALGLILHELLAGAPVFADADGPSILSTLMSNDRPSPPRSTPRALADVLRRAHAADPGRRHADGTALADDLQQARTRGDDPRSRAPLVLAALVVTAVVAGAALIASSSPGAATPPTAPPALVKSPDPPAPAADDPGAALARATGLPEAQRRAALEDWLTRWPQDARAAATRARVDDLARERPRWTAIVPRLVEARFVSTGTIVAVTGDCRVLVLDALTGRPGAAWDIPILPVAIAAISPVELLILGANGAILRTGLDGPGYTTLEKLHSGDALVSVRGATHALACSGRRDAWLVPIGGGPNVRLATSDRNVNGIALSPDATTAVAGCGAGTEENGLRDYALIVWDVPTRKVRAHLDVLSFPAAVAFLDGATFVVATSVGQLFVVASSHDSFDVNGTFVRPEATGVTEEAHASPLNDVASDPSGRFVVTAAGGATKVGNEVALWDVATRTRRWLHTGYASKPVVVDVSPDGSALLVVEPGSERLEVWGPLDALGRAP